MAWDSAVAEITAESARQFDPDVVEAFKQQEASLRRVYYELTTA
jgi:response regulator RpfG family c-di-GMP phosphodiesterase